MSTSDLYILNKKSTTHLAEFSNGWGSGPRCWDHLAEKYLGRGFSFPYLDAVMTLSLGERLLQHEKIALMTTFDWAYIPLGNLSEAADACEKFGVECENGVSVNHWPEIGMSIRKAGAIKHNRHARGVCLSCTSVSDIWCQISPDQAAKAWPIY
ncbi:MAG: hypothetical protein P1U50_00875 [Parvibaculaceae bacterium]|nr:hypothetical protein [Parvibaculaceae bacterium]